MMTQAHSDSPGAESTSHDKATSVSRDDVLRIGGSTASGVIGGAAIGSIGGPVGTLVGSIVGGVTGFMASTANVRADHAKGDTESKR